MTFADNFAPVASFRKALPKDFHGNLSVLVLADTATSKDGKVTRGKPVVVNGVSSIAVSHDRDRFTLSSKWDSSVKFEGDPVILSVLDVPRTTPYGVPMSVSQFVNLFVL